MANVKISGFTDIASVPGGAVPVSDVLGIAAYCDDPASPGTDINVRLSGSDIVTAAQQWTENTTPTNIYYDAGSVNIGTSANYNNTPLTVEGTGNNSMTTAVSVMDSLSSQWFSLRDDKRIIYLDGNEGYNRVLTSDASGVATWQTPGLPKMFGYFQGVMANPGSVGHAQEQVIWSDPIALSSEFGVMIIPFDCKITKVTLKWVGDTAPTIDVGDGTTSWQIGKLTSVTGTTDTTGGTNFTDLTPASTGAGSWEDLEISNANGDSGTFVYKLWNATVLLNAPVQFSADEMLVFRITRGGASWSETSDDITVNLKFQYT